MMNLPQDGENLKKAQFFAEVAIAFEFLAFYNRLPAEKQLELMQYITKLQAEIA